jgi:hypothetical protein
MLESFLQLRNWWEDQSGLETAEWVLVLGALVIPIAFFILQIAKYVAGFHQITSWVSTLPFP